MGARVHQTCIYLDTSNANPSPTSLSPPFYNSSVTRDSFPRPRDIQSTSNKTQFGSSTEASAKETKSKKVTKLVLELTKAIVRACASRDSSRSIDQVHVHAYPIVRHGSARCTSENSAELPEGATVQSLDSRKRHACGA